MAEAPPVEEPCETESNDTEKETMASALLVQYVVVRRDLLKTLNWPTGSVIAQGCHAATAALFQDPTHPSVREYVSHLDHMTKVVLEVKNENALLKLAEGLRGANVGHKVWIEQPENIPTALATLPYRREEIAHLFKKCQLFK
eukprot:comp23172_c0_seq1/m.37525 comp23172_c0_seq1/g.37525  ORF comp23172_c0_seq1/g.37525 comp23172_c0_seq1/m.37525 type:complete len:143 (-) comp23172_c0_seq1:108-536(-)